jgi:hypothetical protein
VPEGKGIIFLHNLSKLPWTTWHYITEGTLHSQWSENLKSNKKERVLFYPFSIISCNENTVNLKGGDKRKDLELGTIQQSHRY